MLISFIVPIYNAENTLERCVESLLNQGLDEGSYEIILINDGSTDRSGAICQGLAEKHSCVRVISQPNAGISEFRNHGIRSACGDYICYVDSDDFLTAGGIASLLPHCDGKNDLIRYWCELVYPNTKDNVDQGDGSVLFFGSGNGYLRRLGLETFCTNYLYRRSFILEHGLFFTPGILGEDFPYMFDVMMADPLIVSVAKRIYHYIIKPESISTSRSPEHSRRWVRDLRDTMTRIAMELEPYRESDPAMFQKCRQKMDDKMVSLFSRSLTAQYTIKEFKALIFSCRKADLIPLESKSNTSVWFLTHFPFLYPISSVIFRRIFLRHIYPRINKYGE